MPDPLANFAYAVIESVSGDDITLADSPPESNPDVFPVHA